MGYTEFIQRENPMSDLNLFFETHSLPRALGQMFRMAQENGDQQMASHLISEIVEAHDVVLHLESCLLAE